MQRLVYHSINGLPWLALAACSYNPIWGLTHRPDDEQAFLTFRTDKNTYRYTQKQVFWATLFVCGGGGWISGALIRRGLRQSTAYKRAQEWVALEPSHVAVRFLSYQSIKDLFQCTRQPKLNMIFCVRDRKNTTKQIHFDIGVNV